VDIKPNGSRYPKYRRNFIHADGVSRDMTANSAKEWEQKRQQHFIDAENDPYGVGKKRNMATYRDIFPDYKIYVETNRSAGTYVKVISLFERYILPRFKNDVISMTTPDEMADFVDKLIDSNGALVVKEVFKVFKPFMKWCRQRKRLFTKNPIDEDVLDTIRSESGNALKQKKTLENEHPLETYDIERIFGEAKGRREAIVYHFMGHTCRLGEALGVKVKDVNIFNKTVTLNHQVQSYPKHMLEGTRYLKEDGFNAGSEVALLNYLKTEESQRRLELLPSTYKLLIDLIADKDPDELIFTTKNGTPCTPNNFRKRYWKPMLERLGLSHKIKLHTHTMRGYIFAKGVANGKDSAAISKAMGHKNISTTLQSYFPNIVDGNKANPLDHMEEIINNS